MPLDTEVKGDPTSIRASADWLGNASTGVQGSGDQTQRANGASETGWVGAAGDGFRRLATRMRRSIDDLAHDLSGTRDALDTHAGDLDEVNREMAHARQIATTAGLTVTPTAILEPGPAPAPPGALPANATPAQRGTHDQAVAAGQAHARQAQAYQQAQDIVYRARDKETESQGALEQYLNGLAEKSPFTIASLGRSFAGTSINRTSKFREKAQRFGEAAERRAGLAQRGGLWNRMKNTVAKNVDEWRQERALARATPTAWSRGLDKLPAPVKTGLTASLGDLPFLPEDPAGFAKVGSKFLKNVPVAGLAITAVGVGYDIHNGKDPVEAVSSAAGATAAGAAVGMVVGGPVGVVLGAAAGMGVGYLIDHNWGGISDAGRTVGHAAADVGKGIGHVGEDIGSGAKKVWDSVF